MAEALINHEVLDWAVKRSELPLQQLAKTMDVEHSKISNWRTGKAKPTFRQAKKIAELTGVPFGYLYLNDVPEDYLPVPDFRTIGSEPGYIDPNTRLLLRQIMFKREWYREYRQSEGFGKLDFVGSASMPISDPNEVARQIRETLGSENAAIDSWSSRHYLNNLVRKAEEVGVWVMNTGVVGNNTHKPLSTSRFRGLSVSDEFVPAILINGQDALAAQIFTFAHELAHLWLGGSGMSNVELGNADLAIRSASEKMCNRIASEFLVPQERFEKAWYSAASRELDQIAYGLSRLFMVSRIVIVRRAFDLSLIKYREYEDFYGSESKRWAEKKRKQKRKSGGGNFVRTLVKRNGSDFTRAVLSEAMGGRLLLRDAGALLGVKPGRIHSIYEALDE